jgi:hypothetical protein
LLAGLRHGLRTLHPRSLADLRMGLDALAASLLAHLRRHPRALYARFTPRLHPLLRPPLLPLRTERLGLYLAACVHGRGTVFGARTHPLLAAWVLTNFASDPRPAA